MLVLTNAITKKKPAFAGFSLISILLQAKDLSPSGIEQITHKPCMFDGLFFCHVILRFREVITSLQRSPEMGTPLLSEQADHIPYRYIICGNYMVFYHFSVDTVYVDRVLYGRRDYMALLFGNIIS